MAEFIVNEKGTIRTLENSKVVTILEILFTYSVSIMIYVYSVE